MYHCCAWSRSRSRSSSRSRSRSGNLESRGAIISAKHLGQARTGAVAVTRPAQTQPRALRNSKLMMNSADSLALDLLDETRRN